MSSPGRRFSRSIFAKPWTKKARCPRRYATITRDPPDRPCSCRAMRCLMTPPPGPASIKPFAALHGLAQHGVRDTLASGKAPERPGSERAQSGSRAPLPSCREMWHPVSYNPIPRRRVRPVRNWNVSTTISRSLLTALTFHRRICPRTAGAAPTGRTCGSFTARRPLHREAQGVAPGSPVAQRRGDRPERRAGNRAGSGRTQGTVERGGTLKARRRREIPKWQGSQRLRRGMPPVTGATGRRLPSVRTSPRQVQRDIAGPESAGLAKRVGKLATMYAPCGLPVRLRKPEAELRQARMAPKPGCPPVPTVMTGSGVYAMAIADRVPDVNDFCCADKVIGAPWGTSVAGERRPLSRCRLQKTGKGRSGSMPGRR